MRVLIGLAVLCLGPTAAAATPLPAPEELHGLTLACDGSASWTQTVTDDNGTIGNFQDDNETKHQRSAAGRVHVSFTPEGGSFRLPPRFATFRAGGPFSFSQVELSGDIIIGKVRGMLGQDRAVRIDRRTGEILVEFAGATFNGVCQKVTDTPGERKF